MKRASVIAWISLGILVLAYLGGNYGRLPETFPTHFDMAGNPNGWSTRSAFLYTFGSLILLINILFFLPFKWIHMCPSSLINLPNKDYWFSTPERKLIGYEKLKTILSITGAFCNLVFLFCVQIIFQESKIVTALQLPITPGVILILTMALGLVVAAFIITKRPSI